MIKQIYDAKVQLICVHNWFEELKRLAPPGKSQLCFKLFLLIESQEQQAPEEIVFFNGIDAAYLKG